MKIKFDYRGKLHILSADTSSVDAIKEGIISRYPGHFKNGMIVGLVKNNAIYEITEWSQVLEEWKKGDGKSVKLHVFEEFASVSKAQKQNPP